MGIAGIQIKIVNELRREFHARSNKNPRYSLRAFAKQLNLPVSSLSEILNQKRPITYRVGRHLVQRLGGMTEFASEIDSLPRKNQNADAAEKKKSFERQDEFEIIARWWDLAILSLAESKDFRSDLEWIARRLGLKIQQVQQSVDRLIRAGLIEKREGQLHSKNVQMTFGGGDLPLLAVLRSHFENLELAEQSLEQDHPSLRDFSFINMVVDPKLIPQIRKRIQNFRRSLCREFEHEGQATEVYRFTTQLFPLTKRELHEAPQKGEEDFTGHQNQGEG